MHTSAPEATHPQVIALSQLADLVSSPYVGVRQHLAEHPAATLEVLAILAEGQVRITQPDGTKVIADAQDGFLSMADNEVTIVAGHAVLAS